MKQLQHLLLCAFLLTTISSAEAQWKKNKANRDSKIFRYDVECEGVAKQGSKLVKVWSYSKNPKYAISGGMKNAVHGVLFKGYGSGVEGCSALEPMIDASRDLSKYADFFDEFFKDGGEYLRYVSSATDGRIAAGDRLKISRREYKIGVIVIIKYNQLRKRMEKEGIVKKLSSGF